jgi:hypothetical protein
MVPNRAGRESDADGRSTRDRPRADNAGCEYATSSPRGDHGALMISAAATAAG